MLSRRPNGSGVHARLTALGIAAVYGFVGALWIGYSDQFVGALELTDSQLTRIQQYKGWAYVTVTAVLLYGLLRWLLARLARSHSTLRRNRDRLLALNRLYRMVRAVKGSVLRIREPDTLLQEACRVAVVEGGYCLAWVALWDPDRRVLRGAAASGPCRARLQGAHLPAERLVDSSPMVAAAVQGRPMFVADMSGDPVLEADACDVDPKGYYSVGAVPLHNEGQTQGALAIYSPHRDAFGDEESELLTEIGATLGLALSFLQRTRDLQALADYDSLTGLPKRELLYERVTQALARSEQQGYVAAVAVLDIDGFRRINDTLGRDAGDRVLRAVADALRGGRHQDTVSRLGNDEFALLLADLPATHRVDTLVNRLADRFPQRMAVDGQQVQVSISIGVAIYPNDADDAEALIGRAELSLHSQSAGARSQTTYYAPELDQHARSQRELEEALRGALDDGELSLAWQPIVDLGHERLHGAEALLRWRHPRLGDVSPARFVPLAEETGDILGIGRWVLDTAFAQAAAWARAGLRPGIHINVSLLQLQNPGFVDYVAELVGGNGNDDHGPVIFEITESQFMSDPDAVARACRELKDLGCRIHVDDFGTGYSALTYLTQLPIDGLKIDRAFIVQAETDPGARAVVEAVVTMAQRLGMETVAEGVETRSQLDMVRTLGCHYVQGFYYGRGVAAEELSATWESASLRRASG